MENERTAQELAEADRQVDEAQRRATATQLTAVEMVALADLLNRQFEAEFERTLSAERGGRGPVDNEFDEVMAEFSRRAQRLGA